MKSNKPIVFGAPSLSFLPKAIRGELTIMPPIKKGDLNDLNTDSPVLIVDGVFAQSLAITPKECFSYINSGRILMGASSMGAIRAAELWKYGMIGIGNIYNMYRMGQLQSDADVAVSYGIMEDQNVKELTYSVAHIAAVLLHIENIGYIGPSTSFKLIQTARKIYFADRYEMTLLKSWKAVNGVSEEFILLFKEYISSCNHHPKVRDAHEAIGYLLPNTWTSPVKIESCARSSDLLSSRIVSDYNICNCCASKLAATALFCPFCVSYAHENQ